MEEKINKIDIGLYLKYSNEQKKNNFFNNYKQRKQKKDFYNLKYGKCHLIKKKKNLYLVYVDKCFNHYIVCNYIEPNSNAMMNQEFFSTLKEAKRYFKKH